VVLFVLFNQDADTILNNTNSTTITFIGGTEYAPNATGRVSLMLARDSFLGQSLVTGATCTVDILYPNSTLFVDNASMNEYGNGIYTYDFFVPETTGVYTYQTNCLSGFRNYYALNTFHVSTNSIAGVLSEITSLETYLVSLVASASESEEFASEQIYLITDAITELQVLSTAVETEKMSPDDGLAAMREVQRELMLKNAMQTPNEIFIEFDGRYCNAFVKNEGAVEGFYEIHMRVADKKEVFEIQLNPDEIEKLRIDLKGLATGEYMCTAESYYGLNGKSSASENVFYNAEYARFAFDYWSIGMYALIVCAGLFLLTMIVRQRRKER
jgi:hypothetical protein